MHSWQEKIHGIRALIREVGPLWPKSTKLAGYGENGPYHCGNCKYLKADSTCTQPVVMADPQVKRDKAGMPIVDADYGCCEFVDPGRD